MVVPGHRPLELMRRVNDLIWESLCNGGRTEPIAFFCECSDPECYRPVWLSANEYGAARAAPSWSALAAEHAVGRSARGHRCQVCGYGVARPLPPERCPMCGSAEWLPQEASATSVR